MSEVSPDQTPEPSEIPNNKELRETWEKYPVSMRSQRMECAGHLSALIYAYNAGDTTGFDVAKDVAVARDMLVALREDEAITPSPEASRATMMLRQLEDYFTSVAAGTPDEAGKKRAGSCVYDLEAMIDDDAIRGQLLIENGHTVSQEERELFTDIVTYSRRQLQYLLQNLSRDGAEQMLDTSVGMVEATRLRLVSLGLKYELDYSEKAGEVFKADEYWLALERLLLRSRERAASKDAKVVQAWLAEVRKHVADCENLIRVIELYQQEDAQPARERYPISMRLQRADTLAFFIARLRGYTYGVLRSASRAARLEDAETLTEYVESLRGYDSFADPLRDQDSVYDQCEEFIALLKSGAATDTAIERQQELLRQLTGLVEQDIVVMEQLAASDALPNDDAEMGEFVQHPGAYARWVLAWVREATGEKAGHVDLAHEDGRLEFVRQSLARRGLAYEQRHREYKGRVAVLLVPWFALEDVIQRERVVLKSGSQAELEPILATIKRLVDDCERLPDLIEEYGEEAE